MNYAIIDENNIVTNIIICNNIEEANTAALILNNNYKAVYANYGTASPAGIGSTYDPENNSFISKKPFNSWILNHDNQWVPPLPYPNDGKKYTWDEKQCIWNDNPSSVAIIYN